MAQYKLYYFDFYGRAETIRVLLSHAKVQFEDIRFSMQDWPNYKPQMPTGQVPVIELANGYKMNQSSAIVRYLGKLYGYYPSDAVESYDVDRLIDSYFDVYVNLYKPAFAAPEAKQEALDLVFKSLPSFLDIIEPICAKGDWLVGSKLSIADFWIGGFYTNFFNNPLIYSKERWDEILAKYPGFKSYGERFAAANATYLASRPSLPL